MSKAGCEESRPAFAYECRSVFSSEFLPAENTEPMNFRRD
jgi:hypothetical protein